MVLGCPHPPHLLPNFIPKRLRIMDFFKQLISLNIEHLGQNVRKGTFLCRCPKNEDFDIGKKAIEETYVMQEHPGVVGYLT